MIIAVAVVAVLTLVWRRVEEAYFASEDSGWWPYLASVEPLAAGNAEGIGARRRFRWRSGLGYGFSVVMTTTRAERLREIEAAAGGDLRGIGLWVIEQDGPGAVRLTYRWDV